MRKLILTLVAGVACSGLVFAAEEAAKTCGLCPLSGKPASEDISVDYKGKKVYFCCPGCPKGFEKAPEKFSAKVNQQLLTTGQIVQVGCPFSGGPVNEDTVVELDGAKFGFCCGKCKAKYEKSDDKVALIFGDIKKGFTMQDKCPVSGKPINTEQSTEYKGKTVYFCCGGCPKAFEANPEKFASKLPKDDDKG